MQGMYRPRVFGFPLCLPIFFPSWLAGGLAIVTAPSLPPSQARFPFIFSIQRLPRPLVRLAILVNSWRRRGATDALDSTASVHGLLGLEHAAAAISLVGRCALIRVTRDRRVIGRVAEIPVDLAVGIVEVEVEAVFVVEVDETVGIEIAGGAGGVEEAATFACVCYAGDGSCGAERLESAA